MYLRILVEILNRRKHRPTRLVLSIAVTGSSGLPPLGKTVNHLPKLPSSNLMLGQVRSTGDAHGQGLHVIDIELTVNQA